MTMRNPRGKTLNRAMRDAEANFRYLQKLTVNTSPTLNRLGSVAVATIPKAPKDGSNKLTLSVRGIAEESARIAKVLKNGVTADQIAAGATVPVKFSRIDVMVTFKIDAAAVNAAQERVKRRIAA